MKFTIQDIQIANELKRISSQIGAGSSYSIVCDEGIIKLPAKIGDGEIKGINFDYGIGLLFFDCTFKQETTVVFDIKPQHPLRLFSCSKGSYLYQFEDADLEYKLNPSRTGICASSGDYVQKLIFPANTEIFFCSLELSRGNYFEKIKCDIDTVPQSFAEALEDVEGKRAYFFLGNYGLSLVKILEEIQSNLHQGLARKTYLESKSMELFSTHVRNFRLEEENSDSLFPQYSEFELTLISNAREILTKDLQNPPTIKELARMVGMNESKLKRLFKIVYKYPPATYLRRHRMITAKLFLISKKMTIQEIAFVVGYSNAGHFSRRFKEHFGVLPNQFLKSLTTEHRSNLVNA